MHDALGKTLGEGAFGDVCTDMYTGAGYPALVAVKKLKKGENASHEMRMMNQVNHPNLLKCMGPGSTPDSIRLPLMEGSLSALAPVDNLVLQQCLRDMLKGLSALAEKGMCHRDVKPDNILYRKRGARYHFRLADFGLASPQISLGGCGTPFFMAPEAVFGNLGQESPKLDVWSLFVTIMAMKGNIRTSRLPVEYEQHHNAVVAAASLCPQLEPMARIDPARRASAREMSRSLRGIWEFSPAPQQQSFAPQQQSFALEQQSHNISSDYFLGNPADQMLSMNGLGNINTVDPTPMPFGTMPYVSLLASAEQLMPGNTATMNFKPKHKKDRWTSSKSRSKPISEQASHYDPSTAFAGGSIPGNLTTTFSNKTRTTNSRPVPHWALQYNPDDPYGLNVGGLGNITTTYSMFSSQQTPYYNPSTGRYALLTDP